MYDLRTIKKMNAPKGYMLMGKQCNIHMPDGMYPATVIGVTDKHVDIELDDHVFTLHVYSGLALNRFKDADVRNELAEFYGC